MLEQQTWLTSGPKIRLLQMAQPRQLADVLRLIVDHLATSQAIALARIWLIRRCMFDLSEAIRMPRSSELSASRRQEYVQRVNASSIPDRLSAASLAFLSVIRFASCQDGEQRRRDELHRQRKTPAHQPVRQPTKAASAKRKAKTR